MPATALSATLTLTDPSLSGVTVSGGVPDAGDAANGNSFVNTGCEVLIVDNVAGTPRTITFKNSAGVDQSALSVAANAMQVIGPFRISVYGSTVTFTPSHAELNCRVYDLSRGRNNILTR